MAKQADIQRLSDTLFEIGGKVRIEQGPVLKRAEATEALLDNAVTAPHYHAPVEKTHQASGKTVTVYAKDAMGQPIEMGKEMAYLDWLGDRTWYVYAKRWVPVLDANGVQVAVDGEPQMREVWEEVDTIDGDEDEALDAAAEILAQED